MENHAEAPLNPGIVFEMMQAHQRTAALKAAIELDVFRASVKARAMWYRLRGIVRHRSAEFVSCAIF